MLGSGPCHSLKHCHRSVSSIHWIKYLLSSCSVSSPRNILSFLFPELGRGKITKLLLPTKATHVTHNQSNQYIFILCVLYMKEVKNYVIRGAQSHRTHHQTEDQTLRKTLMCDGNVSIFERSMMTIVLKPTLGTHGLWLFTNVPREAGYLKQFWPGKSGAESSHRNSFSGLTGRNLSHCIPFDDPVL